MLFIPSFLSKTRRTFPCTGILPVLSPKNKPFIRPGRMSGTLYVIDVFTKPLCFVKTRVEKCTRRCTFQTRTVNKQFSFVYSNSAG